MAHFLTPKYWFQEFGLKSNLLLRKMFFTVQQLITIWQTILVKVSLGLTDNVLIPSIMINLIHVCNQFFIRFFNLLCIFTHWCLIWHQRNHFEYWLNLSLNFLVLQVIVCMNVLSGSWIKKLISSPSTDSINKPELSPNQFWVIDEIIW